MAATNNRRLQSGYSAADRLIQFSKLYGEQHLELAYHAALPITLSPDLLYQIWINFVPQTDWIAVSDLLLSGLCHEVGYELYEIDSDVRALLLREFISDERFGATQLSALAEFLIAFASDQQNSDSEVISQLAQAQRWTALAYTRPGEAACELADYMAALTPGDLPEALRISSLVNELSEPLRDYQPLLLYARGIDYLINGNAAQAEQQFYLVKNQGNSSTPAVDALLAKGITRHLNIGEKTEGSLQSYRSEKLQWLLDQISYFEEGRKALAIKAFRFAEEAHAGQRRSSGEPYITHCVGVAAILAEMHVSPVMVVAGLLHDTLEDTMLTLDDLRREFGEEVANLVNGVTKLTILPRLLKESYPADSEVEKKQPDIEPSAETPSDSSTSDRKRNLASETLRRIFIAMGDDVRVVLIKLTDRLHNMRTLGYMPEQKRRQIAQETLDIYSPLAERLGIWKIKSELEDLAFRYLNPEVFKEIADALAEKWDDQTKSIQQIIEMLQKIMDESGISVTIIGRKKHIYSIYKKMEREKKPFDLIQDVRGVRLIVSDIPSCYAALGVIHTHWRPIQYEFDDYIAAPKDNFYQSLHTAIIFDDGKPLEVQIRTLKMDQNAEFGIASHWRDKEGTQTDVDFEQRVSWLRRLMDWHQDVEDVQGFDDEMKIDVIQDRVYVFTPKGDIVDLPAGSTSIDFAYYVHTEIGHRCREAKINGKLVNLDRVLRTGDQVEILTAKQGGPNRDWLNPNLGLVKTPRARNRIIQWFRAQEREQNITQGKELFEKELKRLSFTVVNIEKLTSELNCKSPDDFYYGIGCGDISLSHIIIRLLEGGLGNQDLLFDLKEEVYSQTKKEQFSYKNITVLGLKGILTTIARCCNPSPGDEIVGYITRSRGATIHRKDCPNLRRINEKERLVMVSWGEQQKKYQVPVEIKAFDRHGLIGDISNLMGNEKINTFDLTVKVLHNVADINLVIEVSNILELNRVLTRIETLPNVLEARWVRPQT